MVSVNVFYIFCDFYDHYFTTDTSNKNALLNVDGKKKATKRVFIS